MLHIFQNLSQIYATLDIGSELWILSVYTSSLKYNNSWNGICAQNIFSLYFHFALKMGS